MFRSFIDFCLKESILVLIFFGVLAVAGFLAMKKVPVDAIPNIGQNQVIVTADWEGRSPKDVEDQITYPLSISLLSVPGATAVRGKSLFGYSFVQITFDDDIDFYWARSRVSEQLTSAVSQLPEGVTPTLGPDATGLGQIFYYTLVPTDTMNLTKLRSLQDYVVKYALSAVDGVSEVASIGGYKKEYHVDIDPNKLRFHKIPLNKLVVALKKANSEVGAGTVEQSAMEFIIRGKGYLGRGGDSDKIIEDIENTVVISKNNIPIRIKDLGFIQKGNGFRRGALDVNGSEAVGGIVVMRNGKNPVEVIKKIKEKISQLEPNLRGVKIVPIYDRTNLIKETIATLTESLFQEIVITIVIVVIFLLHLRTSLIIAISLPMAVLLSYIAMYLFKLDANIMSLAGIVIAIGNMVDMGIIIVEGIYEKLAKAYKSKVSIPLKEKSKLIAESLVGVAPAILTATATTVISFLPVFLLTGRDYKLFSPLAYTKSYALISALIVSVILLPILCKLFLSKRAPKKNLKTIRTIGFLVGFTASLIIVGLKSNFLVGTSIGLMIGVLTLLLANFLASEDFKPIEENKISTIIIKLYRPSLYWCLNHRKLFLFLPTGIFVLGLLIWQGVAPMLAPFEYIFSSIGIDPDHNSTYRGFKKSLGGLKSDDWIALDEGTFFYMPTLFPASAFSESLKVLQTQNTLIKTIPEVSNVLGKIGRANSALDPAPAAMIETYVTLKPKSEWREGINSKDIWKEINQKATLPGVTPASFLQPIEGRVIMLQSGIKASMALRIYGDSLVGLNEAANNIANYLKLIPAVNKDTVNPDIVLGKPYSEFDIDRITSARYNMTISDVNNLIETALGGKIVTKTIEGRERYGVKLRYLRSLRDSLDSMGKTPVYTNSGHTVPMEVLAKNKTLWGPAAINSEDARLVAHVSFSPSGVYGAIETIEKVMTSLNSGIKRGDLKIPPGYELQPVGSFQNQIEANNRLMWLIPFVILCNILIIYLQFRNIPASLIVFSGIPIAFGGGMLLLGILSFKINTAIWIGFIALFGIAVDNGVILISFILQYFKNHTPKNKKEFMEGIVISSVKRVRPCLMTTATTLIALIPVMVSEGRGADVARAMALPIFGGMLFALLGLYIVPVLYASTAKLDS